MSAFQYDKDANGIVTITMDMTGPVNTMNEEFSNAMIETVDRLEHEKDLVGVVIASAKKTFFAGGDLRWLLSIEPGSEAAFFEGIEGTKLLLRRLEKLPVPVVATINGAALGGGYELCLACNHRIAWNDGSVQIGLPEVTLGLLPGGGGVVRMVNLLGLEAALPYLLEGKRVTSDEALAAGMIDQLVEDPNELISTGKQWILANKDEDAARVQPWDTKGFKVPGGSANSPQLAQTLMGAPAMVHQKTRGLLPAPEYILDVAVNAARLPFDVALRIEGRHFANLVTTPQAKNMITTLFFAVNKVNGGASRPNDIAPQRVKKLGILGAGMMGQGIAYVSALAGIDVVLKDVSLRAAEKGRAYSERLLDKKIARGRLDEDDKARILRRISPTESTEDLQGCDLIVEAVFEKIDLKYKVTRESESCLAEDGIWGSNTSTLPITRLAEASARPERFIGLHFFSPVDKMPLLEIICGEQTTDETLARAFDYARQIKKTPIVVNDSPGFYTSRTISTQTGEALAMVAEGVHPVRVENAGKAIGMPVGTLTLLDELSLTLLLDIQTTHKSLGLITDEDDPTPQATQTMKEMIAVGRIGRKGGKGFFDWSDSGKRFSAEVIDKYYKEEVQISERDIKDRLLFRPVIESLQCLDDGVLRSVEDGNVGSIMGIGAPVWTGGYLQFVNTYGLDKFVTRCEELARRYGDRFTPPALVVKKAKAGELVV